MNPVKMLRSFILCAVSLGATIQAETNIQHDASIASQQDYTETNLIRGFSQLQQIDTLVAQLALLVTNHSIKNIPNPSETILILKNVRILINSVSQKQAIILSHKDQGLNIETTYNLTELCEQLILYLEKALAQQLRHLKPFGFNQPTTRGQSIFPTHTELTHKTKAINNKLDSLQSLIANAGLTWYNKVARTADKYIVTPVSNYHIPTIAFYAAGVSFMGTYGAWLYGKELMESTSTPHIIKELILEPLHKNNYVGEAIPSGQYGHATDTDAKNHGPIAIAELFIRETLGGRNIPITMAGGYLLQSFAKEPLTQIKKTITEHKDLVWNYLRGGAYLEQQTSGLTLFEPTTTFDNMVGLDEVKKELSTLIRFLEEPELFANMNASPEQGWLLTGPKRTGKSFSFKCLCGEIERSFKKRGLSGNVKFWEIDASHIHEHGIKKLLFAAQQEGPMVLFIDEIDLLDLNRVGDRKLLNEFLTAIQTSKAKDPSKVVIILAATNKPQTLDPALRASGRFGKEIRFEYPAKKYRVKYIADELTSMALNVEEFDINRLAEKTDQRSFEDISSIICTAMRDAWRTQQQLTQKLLEDAIDTTMHHIIMTDRKEIPDSENRILATHFAGRALATLYLNTNKKLDKVTIKARMTELVEEGQWEDLYNKNEKDRQQKIEYGALLTKSSHDSIDVKNAELITNEIKALLSGFIAEELILGSCGFSCHAKNNEIAYKLIEQLVFEGIDPKLFAKTVSEQKKQQAFTMLQQCKNEVKQLLNNHLEALKSIADELMAKRILTDSEIQMIIDKAEGRTTNDKQDLEEITPAPAK